MNPVISGSIVINDTMTDQARVFCGRDLYEWLLSKWSFSLHRGFY